MYFPPPGQGRSPSNTDFLCPLWGALLVHFLTVCLLQEFAINLEKKVLSINEALQMKSLTFVIDACKVLTQARKVSSAFWFSWWHCYRSGLTGSCCPFAGAGLLLHLQLLQPRDGEDGSDGAADGGSGSSHQRSADPAW